MLCAFKVNNKPINQGDININRPRVFNVKFDSHQYFNLVFPWFTLNM